MPKPNTDETKEAFAHRYMADEEARKSFPDEKQRYAVAMSLWEHRNTLEEAMNAMGAHGEREGAEPFGGLHLQPGIVGYPEMKHPISGKQGIDILVKKDVIDAMRPSARGVPIVNWMHDMSGGAERWIKEGKAVGVMVSSYWNGDQGMEGCETMVWDKEAKANCRNGFRWSNAWKEDEIDWTPGMHNGKPYDGLLKAAHYTHLAIVPNPRYEGAVIYANSKGGLKAMFKLLGLGKAEPVELDKTHPIEVNGQKRTLEECVNALAAADAAKATVTAKHSGELKDEDVIEIAGVKRTILECKNALIAAEKAPVKKEEKVVEAEKKLELTEKEFANAVDARVKEALEKAVGEGFFNGIAKLAQLRPGDTEVIKTSGRNSEKERIQLGKERFGSKKKPVAA